RNAALALAATFDLRSHTIGLALSSKKLSLQSDYRGRCRPKHQSFARRTSERNRHLLTVRRRVHRLSCGRSANLAEITKQIIRVVNWAKFQHYKDRNPPWIKLHRELLISRTWLTADDASRVLAIVCMVLAAETGNKIPLDIAYIKRRAYLNQEPDFPQLIPSQFSEIVDASGTASNVLGDASALHTNARPETETEAEAETQAEAEAETEKRQRRAKRSGADVRSLPDWLPIEPWKGFLEM